MADKYTADELNKLGQKELVGLVLSMQDQVSRLNTNLETLIEAVRADKQNHFGRQTERLDQIVGQLSLFNEAEGYAEDAGEEPGEEEVIITVRQKKKKGQREEDVKGLPREPHDHLLTDEQLDEYFGKGCWRRMPQEKYIRVRCQPAVYTVEDHTVDVAVGTNGDHQDEFLRGDRPKDLLRNSIVTPSLMAAIMNTKFVNSLPYYRLENEFRCSGLNLSRQTMANWTVLVAEKYLMALVERFREEQMKETVLHCDETPVQVIHDNDPNDPNDQKRAAGHKNYMWVHRSGEFNTKTPTIIFEYLRGRGHEGPLEYYKDFNGILMTDGLNQYHMIASMLPGLTNANCWAHARRDYADALKAIGKGNEKAIKTSLAYQALARIKTIYKIEGTLSDLSPEERLRERQKSIKPLVDEYFTWVKERLADTTVLPKGKTAEGLNYSVNQEKYLRVFLTDGNCPIDDSACERAIRPFCVGKKNWLFINTAKGARASAAAYTVCQTARANNLNVYRYLEHILTELPKLADEKGNIDTSKLDHLLPWSDELPAQCHKPRR